MYLPYYRKNVVDGICKPKVSWYQLPDYMNLNDIALLLGHLLFLQVEH